MNRQSSYKSRWSLVAVLIVASLMTLSSVAAGAALGGFSGAAARATATTATPASHATPAATNTGTTSTDLGSNTVPVGGSVGVTLPNAIPTNYTRPVPLEPNPFSYSPTVIYAGSGVLFVTGGVTGGVPPYTSSWTFWNSAGSEIGTANGDSASFTFASAGTYTVVNNFVDGVGNTNSANATLTVYDPLRITVTPASTTVTTNTNLTLHYAITGGSGLYCLNWTNGYSTSVPYGDNSCPSYPSGQYPIGTDDLVPATGSNITHWPYPGSYQPTFVVTDDLTGATAESAFYINVNNNSVGVITPPLGGTEYTSLYAYPSQPYEPYASPIKANVTTMPMTDTTDIVAFPTGGSGNYAVTVVWGDGSPNTPATFFGVNSSWSHVPGYYATHVYNTPAIYQIATFVNDSLGNSEKLVDVLTVTYVAPTVQIGYVTDNNASTYPLTPTEVLKSLTFSKGPTNALNIAVSVARATQGFYIWGSLVGGESPFTGSLSNASSTNPSLNTVTGIETTSGFSVPSSCFRGELFTILSPTPTCYTNVSSAIHWSPGGYVFATNVPGTYHFGLTMTDNVGNLAGASLNITVVPIGLSVLLTPHRAAGYNIAAGGSVTFSATIWNVTVPASLTLGGYPAGESQTNVSFTFFSGIGPPPTYGAYGTRNIWFTFNGPEAGGIVNSTIPFYVETSAFLSAATVTYHVVGTFTANATVNYGQIQSFAPGPANGFFSFPSVIIVTAHGITVYFTTVPYPPDVYTGQSVLVTAHVTGGNGFYKMYTSGTQGRAGTQNVWIHDPNEVIAPSQNNSGHASLVSNTVTNFYASNSTYYYNLTWYVWYPAPSAAEPGGVFNFQGYMTDPTYSGFNLTFNINIQVSAPLPLSVSLNVSEFSYAGSCYFPQVATPFPQAENACAASGTHWTAYLNISGSVGPYETSIYFSAGPGSIFAPLVNLTGSGPGIDASYCVGVTGNFTGNTCNYPTGEYYFVGSFAAFVTAPGTGTSANYVFSGVYVSPTPTNSPGDYINAEHAIKATVTAEGQLIPVFGHPTQTVIADTYGIPYIITSLELSQSVVTIPNDIAAVAPTFFGEYPNLQQYTYFWELVNDTSMTAVSFANTTSDAVSFYVPAGGDYTIYVIATSTISGESAAASMDFTAIVAPPLVQVISTRAQVQLDRVAPTSPPPNPYNAFAGEVTWGADGTVYISFGMPGANFTVNSIYAMDVTFSYTLGITVYGGYPGYSWQTYFYNVYKPDYYSATLDVLAQGTLTNVTGGLAAISQQIANLNNTVSVSAATLASLITSGFASVNNGLLTIQDQGATIIASLASVNASIQTIGTNVITLQTDLGSISTTLSGIQATLATINGDVMTLTTDVGTLTTSVSALSASIATIQGNTVTILTDLGTVMATTASINTQVTTVGTSSSPTLLGRTVDIQTSLGSLSGTVAVLNATTASIQTAVGMLQVTANSIKSDTGSIQSNTNQVTTYFVIVIVLVLIAIVAAVLAVVRVNSVARRVEDAMQKQGSGGMGGSSGGSAGSQQPPRTE